MVDQYTTREVQIVFDKNIRQCYNQWMVIFLPDYKSHESLLRAVSRIKRIIAEHIKPEDMILYLHKDTYIPAKKENIPFVDFGPGKTFFPGTIEDLEKGSKSILGIPVVLSNKFANGIWFNEIGYEDLDKRLIQLIGCHPNYLEYKIGYKPYPGLIEVEELALGRMYPPPPKQTYYVNEAFPSPFTTTTIRQKEEPWQSTNIDAQSATTSLKLKDQSSKADLNVDRIVNHVNQTRVLNHFLEMSKRHSEELVSTPPITRNIKVSGYNGSLVRQGMYILKTVLPNASETMLTNWLIENLKMCQERKMIHWYENIHIINSPVLVPGDLKEYIHLSYSFMPTCDDSETLVKSHMTNAIWELNSDLWKPEAIMR